MNVTSLVDLAGTGATWVLYLLVGLSAIQLAVIIERGIVFYARRPSALVKRRVREALATGNMKLVGLAAQGTALDARVIAAGAANADRGVDAADEIMHSTLAEEKLQLERGLSFLGTLGNNAPFLGLFGTVLGIIHAMASMSTSVGGQESRAAMEGISEALISTAVGLLVALPAVVAFNFFQRTIKTRSVTAQALGGELVAQMKSPADVAALRKTAEQRKAA